MAEMKVALLDRRYGTHGGHSPNNWVIRNASPDLGDIGRGENTYSIIDAFGSVMSGSVENGSNFNDLTEYDAIIMRVRYPIGETPHIRRLREACPKPKLIAYTDEWVNYKTEDLHKHGFKELSENVDAIVCGFGKEYQQEIFEGMGITNYHHLAYGGDVSFWKKFYRPFSKKSNYIVGMWHLRSIIGQGAGDLRHTDTFDALQHICKENGVKAKFFLNYDGAKHINFIRDYLNRISFDCELIKHVSNTEFNEIMSKAKLFYEEYPTPAYSRATVVSACVGTPSISNYLNDPSRICFPDLTVENKDIDGVKRLGDKLLSDKIFWKDQAKQGRNNVEYYNYHALKDRIIQLVNTI